MNELVDRRRALGLSQDDIATAGGFADGHINKLEAFDCIAQFPTLQLWAQTLGLQTALMPVELPAATHRSIERRAIPLRSTRQHKDPHNDLATG